MNETTNPLNQGGADNRRKTWMTATAIVLAVVAAASVALSIYFVQQNHQLSADITTKNNQIADLQKQASAPAKTTPSTTQPADPYAGWKTYCDTVEKACFKYPSNWTLDASSQNGIVSASVLSPAHSVVGNYHNNDTRDGFTNPYYPAAIEDLGTPNANYKVLGGFVATTTTVSPEYKVVDASFTKGLTVGQQGTTEDTARFSFKDGRTEGSLELRPGTMTQDQAKAWFATDDAKTADLIARSFYLE